MVNFFFNFFFPFYSTFLSIDASSINFLEDHRFFSDVDADVSIKEDEVDSWLLPTPEIYLNSSQYLFSESELVPCIDLDYAAVNPKAEQKCSGTADCAVPVQSNFESFVYNYKYNSTQSQSQSQMSHSVSSSLMEVRVVPEGNTMSEISNYSCSKVATVIVTSTILDSQ